jgi:hypothetical protein
MMMPLSVGSGDGSGSSADGGAATATNRSSNYCARYSPSCSVALSNGISLRYYHRKTE